MEEMQAIESPDTRAAPLPRSRTDRTKPFSPTWRVLRAHTVTLVVLSSYLWLRFRSRYRSAQVVDAALARAHRRNARRIYRAIVSLQGLYIKVGQLFSVMANFLPEAFRRELAGLQDQVPARSYEAIEHRIRDEFGGKGPLDLFEQFDPTPIASASIGQVHAATLPGGHKVAVKVQYPDIERIVRADLTTLRRIFRLVRRFINYRGMDSVYREIRALVLEELDFTAEARNVEQVASAFTDRPQIGFPRVIRELTTKRVITTEFVEGVKINDRAGLARLGVDRSALAKLVIEAYCTQIFHHGRYHADPHPGNILVQDGPSITFIDFGAVGELSENMRRGLVQLLQAAINRDTQRITGALRDMGFIAHRADPAVYDRVIEYLHTRFQREVQLESFNLKDIRFDPQRGFENLADLRQMDISLGDITDTFHVPKEWIMLERTILMLTGLCTELDPNLNPMTVIRPHVEHFVLGEDGDWSRFMLDTGKEVALSVLALPAELRKFTTRVLQGHLQVRVAGQHEAVSVYYALGHQMIYTALAITSGVAALQLHERHLADFAFGAAATGGLFLLLLLRSMWVTGKLLRRRGGG